MRTYLTAATGAEDGEYIGVDFGGTNLRALRVHFEKGSVVKKEVKRLNLKKVDKTGTREQLFDKMAQLVGSLSLNPDQKYSLGFVCAFPMQQNSLNDGRLIKWQKGFDIAGVEGENVIHLFQEALDRNGLTNISVKAVLNDTPATHLLVPSATAAMIFSSGFDTTMVDPRTEEILNMESGDFRVGFTTPYDEEVYNLSVPKQSNRFEKRITGSPLGELTRLILRDLNKQGRLFLAPLLTLDREESFSNELMSKIEGAQNLREVIRILEEEKTLNVSGVRKQDAQLVLEVSQLVSNRAARLVAATLTTIIREVDPHLQKKEHIIAVDGSVYNKYTRMKQRVHEAMREIVGDYADKIKLISIEDASGIGAAMAAARVESQEKSDQAIPRQEDTKANDKATATVGAKDTVGGIDFNPAYLDLEIKRDGKGVPLPVNLQDVEAIKMRLNGFQPVMINVTPAKNLLLLLGITESSAVQPQLSSVN